MTPEPKDMEIVLHSRRTLSQLMKESEQEQALAVWEEADKQRSWLSRLFWRVGKAPTPAPTPIPLLPPAPLMTPEEKNALVNINDPNRTPLQIDEAFYKALTDQHWNVARAALQKGARINRFIPVRKYATEYYESYHKKISCEGRMVAGTEPLLNHIIEESMNPQYQLEAVRFLLEYGANINLRCQITGQDALGTAIRAQNSDMARLIMSHGPKPSCKANQTEIHHLTDASPLKTSKGNNNWKIYFREACENMHLPHLAEEHDAMFEAKSHPKPAPVYNIPEVNPAPEPEEEEDVIETWKMQMMGCTLFGTKENLEEVKAAQEQITLFMKPFHNASVIPMSKRDDLIKLVAAHQHLAEKVTVKKDGEEATFIPYAIVMFDPRKEKHVVALLDNFITQQELNEEAQNLRRAEIEASGSRLAEEVTFRTRIAASPAGAALIAQDDELREIAAPAATARLGKTCPG